MLAAVDIPQQVAEPVPGVWLLAPVLPTRGPAAGGAAACRCRWAGCAQPVLWGLLGAPHQIVRDHLVLLEGGTTTGCNWNICNVYDERFSKI